MSAEELLARSLDENADPFDQRRAHHGTRHCANGSANLIIATVAGVGYRINAQPEAGREALKQWCETPGLSVRLKLTLSYAGFSCWRVS